MDEAREQSAWLVALLTLAMFINYADRGSLAVAAPLLQHTLAIEPWQLGMLLSAFFWSYALMQPIAGMVVHRWPVTRVLPAALVVWSLATVACGLAGGFATLFALRLAVGIGESTIYPGNARLLVEHVPLARRGAANAAITVGMCLGPVAGTLAGGTILAAFGWRAVFFVLGGISLLWLPLWLTLRLPPAAARTAAPLPVPGWGEILAQRTLWGIGLGQFTYSYSAYMLLAWLPTFLVQSEHYPLAAMALIGPLVPAAQALGGLVSGNLTDRAIAAGHDPGAAHTRFLMAGMAVCAVMMAGATFAGHASVLAWLIGAAFGYGLVTPLTFAAGQMLAGPRAAGRWMGVQNLIGNLSGVAAPMVTGVAVQLTGSYRPAFAIAGGLALLGVLAYGPLAGQIRTTAWRVAPA